MITITWTSEETRYSLHGVPEYYKIGAWFLDGEEQGILESPCDSDFNLLTEEQAIIQALEQSIVWQR